MIRRLIGLFALILAFGVASPAIAFDRGDFLIRVRALGVVPDDSSGTISTIPGAKIGVNGAMTGELDFTYMVTCNFGLELILATARHTIGGRGTLTGTEIGKTWLLPPTLMAQYHFFPCCRFQPYIGVGINYTAFYSEKSSLPGTKVNLSNSWGVAAQVGIDVMLTDCWFLNFDAKWIDMRSTARLTGTIAGRVRVDVDPWLLGVGIGRRF